MKPFNDLLLVRLGEKLEQNKRGYNMKEGKIHMITGKSDLKGYVVTLCGILMRKETTHGTKDTINCKRCIMMIKTRF